MSSTGYWIIGIVPDAEAQELPRRFGLGTPAQGADTKLSAWWKGVGGGSETFFVPDGRFPRILRPTPAALRFVDLVEFLRPDSDAVEAMEDACMELIGEAPEEGRFVAAIRKANPVAALLYGLGAAGALLPGRAGSFLLTADEVRETLPRVEETLAVEGDRRTEVLERIDTWATGMGDPDGFDSAELLDGPLRVLGHAAEAGSGAAGLVRWY